MATYTGEVIATTDDDFPFMAIITDDDGKVIGEFPVRTEADGEAKVMAMLRDLEDRAKSGDALL
jgi:hypothetical protein